MHFTYEHEKFSAAELCQGDVLSRTPELDSLLDLVHQHFHKKSTNLYFMVLTQTCDLVPRAGGSCKARYITLAPVRNLELVLAREIESQALAIEAELPVLTDKAKSKLTEFLTRLYNNNEPNYFFLESSGTPLLADCCAYLDLSIAVKTSEHYSTCVKAKTLQLKDTFQAKLGWLIGQMYSRVGTDDWESKLVNAKAQAALKNAAIWIPEVTRKHLEQEFHGVREGGPAPKVTAKEILSAMKKMPKKQDQILQQVDMVVLKAMEETLRGHDPANITAVARRVRKLLDADLAFQSLTR